MVEALDRWVCPTVLGELTLSLRHLAPSALTRLPFVRRLYRGGAQRVKEVGEGGGEGRRNVKEDGTRARVGKIRCGGGR